MKKVFLSDSGPETSSAIYSFWRWENEEQLDKEKIKEIISFTLSLGINAFDISPIYGKGKLEELFGIALSELNIEREKIVLFSKIGVRLPQEDGSVHYKELTEKSIKEQIELSLQRLNSTYLDVLLIHDFDPLMNIDSVASTLTSLQLRGKVKHIGVSNFNVQQHKLIASRLSNEVVTNHFELNLLNTKALEDGRIDFIKENYSKPMAFGPLADGRILNGNDQLAISVRKSLEVIAAKYNSNIEQISVAWIYKLGALPIIGSLNKERIQNAATASDIQLTHADWHYIYESTKIN
ncbi:MAG: aldo/keto reductase family oxidoreductase [Flavobacteriia bacterium]|jgi:predicted oxidoreductase